MLSSPGMQGHGYDSRKKVRFLYRVVPAVLMMILLCSCSRTYPYLFTDGGCHCERFVIEERAEGLRYTYMARYSVRDGISTTVSITIENIGHDTLDLSHSYVAVHSRNVPYRYNGRSLPVTIPFVAPGKSETITLEGHVERSVVRDPWLVIAGEEVVVTLKGMRIKGREIPGRRVTLVPVNPRLES